MLEENKLGSIGAGYMSRPITPRLLRAGFTIATYDLHRTIKIRRLAAYWH
jgi:3-hydroxyisobutyrate dehydrogenase-like beta-hydroxyacid dehydrogenase